MKHHNQPQHPRGSIWWLLPLWLLLGWGVLPGCPHAPPLPTETQRDGQQGIDASPSETAKEPQLDASADAEPAPDNVPEQPKEQPPEPQIDMADTPRQRPAPLPFPSTYPPITGGTILKDQNPAPNIVEVSLEARPMEYQLTPKHKFEIYAYNGMLPGPIIEAKLGDELIVHFTNKLSEPTTVHWHGQRVPEAMDGAPLVQTPVAPGGTFTYKFKLRDAGTYWYHPHVHSHEQVEKGLYGMLVVREPTPIAFARSRALLLDDILLTDSGLAPFHKDDQELIKGRIGSQLLVNGKPTPVTYQAKAGERERWRLVNTANARVFRLKVKGDGAEVRIVGVDSGLLAKPFAIDRFLELSPGQRYDLEVMMATPGKVELIASVVDGSKYKDVTLFQVEVTGDAVAAPMAYPMYPEVAPLPQRAANRNETLTFQLLESPDPGGNHWLINGKAHPTTPLFNFKTGDVVLFTLHNLANPNHPFHLHGQFFEVVSRNDFPVKDEPGLRDTVLVHIQERVVIKAYLDNPGRWMFHCHNLEHAASGMMAHIKVDP